MTAIDLIRRRPRRGGIPLLATLSLLAATGAHAATITVDAGTDPAADNDDQCTLREALANANAGAPPAPSADCAAGVDGADTLVFADELAGTTIVLEQGELAVAAGQPLTIDGGDPAAETEFSPTRVTLDANGTEATPSDNASRLLTISADTTLEELFLAGGRVTGDNGGTIAVNGAALSTLRVGISDSMAARAGDGSGGLGGAIYVAAGGSLTMENSAISGSIGEGGGGAVYDNSGVVNSGSDRNISLINVTISQCRAGVFEDVDEDPDFVKLRPVAGSTPADGGALYLPNGGELLDSENDPSTLSDSVASGRGGGVWTAGPFEVVNSVIGSNSAFGSNAGDGGGNIYGQDAEITLTLTTLLNGEALGNETGTAGGTGGNLLANGGTIATRFGVVGTGYATQAGGGVALRNGAELTTTNTLFADNGAQDPGTDDSALTPVGGALHAQGAGAVQLTGGALATNVAGQSGGALWTSASTVTLEAVAIRGNTAQGDTIGQGGGALYQSGTGTLNVIDGRMIGNAATGDAGSGGVVFLAGGTLDLTGGTYTRNSAERAGGVLEVTGGTAMLTGVILGGDDSGDGNMAGGTPGVGGAVHIGGGSVTIADSTVSYNTASQGGGLWNGAGTLTVRNTTVSNNQATGGDMTSGDGGGLYQASGGSTDLTFVTVVRNRAADTGGGIGLGAGPGAAVNATASIIAENSAATGDNFVDGDVTLDEASLVGTDAGLDQLQLFGGPTLTHPLLTDSAAVDQAAAAACDATPLNRDQRGALRPADGDDDGTAACDAGSYERTDDPVIEVTANDQRSISAVRGEDLLVLAFTLRNAGDQAVNLSGFTAEPLFNGGFGSLISLLPADFDGAQPLEFEVVEDTDGDGVLDDDETTVVGQDTKNLGRHFAFTGGRNLDAGGTLDLLVVLRAPGGASDGATSAWLDHQTPLYAGGTLLALLGVLAVPGFRRRTRWVLAIGVVAVGLTACSNADDIPPPDPIFFGDPALQGDIRFRVVELQGMAGSADDIVIGDGLPVYGPAIFVQ